MAPFKPTGRPAAEWEDSTAAHAIPTIGPAGAFPDSCQKLVQRQLNPEPAVPRGIWKKWGVVVAGHRSETRALKSFARAQNRFPSMLGGKEPFVVKKRNPAMGRSRIALVMIGADNRADAENVTYSFTGMPVGQRTQPDNIFINENDNTGQAEGGTTAAGTAGNGSYADANVSKNGNAYIRAYRDTGMTYNTGTGDATLTMWVD